MTLLIVDDEYYCVENLKNKLDWSDFGFSNVLCAYSMMQAQDLFEKNRIDVMICDVEMPHGSGLELLRWVREQNFDAECIFLTCYARFDYASAALKLGSSDYLLKPVEKEALIQSLSHVIIRIQQKEAEQVNELHARYWQKSESLRAAQFWLNVIHGNILSEHDDLASAAHDMHLSGNPINEHYLSVLLSCKQDSRLPVWKPELFEYALKNILDEVLMYCDKAPAIITVSRNEYFVLIPCPENEKTMAQNNVLKAYKACCHIMPGQFRFYIDAQCCDAESVAGRYRLLSDYMQEDIGAKSSLHELSASDLHRSENAEPVIAVVKEYIKSHLQEDLSRNDIAQAVFLSPDYLSHIFHEKTGKSLTGYITDKRIQKAEKLLLKSNMSIRDIAIACGFQNISYFSRQFKACTGKTPQEYSKTGV